MSHCSSRRRTSILILSAVALAGCGQTESITTVDEPRTSPQAADVDVDQVRNSLDHMLAAIVPDGDRAWFFKLVAHGPQIEAVRKDFADFLASVELKEGGQRPSWKLPQGWQEQPGDSLRAATIEVPVGSAKLPLSISSLSYTGEWEPYVERNVNRWMNQLQQSPLSAAKVAELAQETPIQGGRKATLFELTGVMEEMPMAGRMPPGHPPVDTAPPTMPAGTSPSDGSAADSPSAEPPATGGAVSANPGELAQFTYKLPEGWQSGGAKPMRVATFVAGEGTGQAELAVTTFPANAMMSDPTEQAKRWAGLIGLQLSEAEIDAAKSAVTIDGIEGQQYLLAAEEDASPATLAAMIQRGDAMWFFKMNGQRATVESHRESFGKFLESIKFKQ